MRWRRRQHNQQQSQEGSKKGLKAFLSKPFHRLFKKRNSKKEEKARHQNIEPVVAARKEPVVVVVALDPNPTLSVVSRKETNTTCPIPSDWYHEPPKLSFTVTPPSRPLPCLPEAFTLIDEPPSLPKELPAIQSSSNRQDVTPLTNTTTLSVVALLFLALIVHCFWIRQRNLAMSKQDRVALTPKLDTSVVVNGEGKTQREPQGEYQRALSKKQDLAARDFMEDKQIIAKRQQVNLRTKERCLCSERDTQTDKTLLQNTNSMRSIPRSIPSIVGMFRTTLSMISSRFFNVKNTANDENSPSSSLPCKCRAMVKFDGERARLFQELLEKTRHSYMESFVMAPKMSLSSPLSASVAETRQRTASFSMAAGIIKENQFFPAMMSAVAHLEDID